MKKIITLIYIKFLISKRRIISRITGNRFSLWLLTGLSIGMFLFTFLFCRHLFKYINDFDETGPLLNLKILEYFTVFLIMMDLLSNIIVALNLLMDSKEFSFLMSFPISPVSMSVFKSMEISFISNWMAYLIGFTIFFSWALVSGINLMEFIIVFGVLWGVLLFMTSLGAFLIVQMIFSVFPVRWISRLIHFTIISVSVTLIFVIRALKPEKLVNPDVREALQKYILDLRIPLEDYIPTHWLVSAISGRTGVLITFAMLAAVVLVLMVLIVLSGKKSFYRRMVLSEKKGTGSREFQRVSIFQKDLKVFFRTPGEMNQLIIVFGIIAIYAYNMVIIPQANLVHSFAVNLINLGILVLILIAISSRFILTSFTKESHSIWLLLKCPISKQEILLQKLRYALLFLLPLGILLVFLTNLLLKLPLFFKICNLYFGLCISLVISFTTLYYSIEIFDFAPSRPEALIMTPTGAIFMIVSFALSMIYVCFYFVLLHLYFVKMAMYGQYGIFISFTILVVSFVLLLTYFICKAFYLRGIFKLGLLYSDYER